jgi:hypothetical protein
VRYGNGWIATARGDLAVEIPVLYKMARDAGRDLASIEIRSFGLGEDLDRLKRFRDLGVARVVPMFPYCAPAPLEMCPCRSVSSGGLTDDVGRF